MSESNGYLNRPDTQPHLTVMAVLRRWDPIGVVSERNQDEYDGYSASFVRLLDSGASVDDLLTHMRGIVHDSMGMSHFDEAHSRRCAEEMVNFWRAKQGSG